MAAYNDKAKSSVEAHAKEKRPRVTKSLLFPGRERATQMGSFLVPDADLLRPLRFDASRHRASGTQVFRYIGSNKHNIRIGKLIDMVFRSIRQCTRILAFPLTIFLTTRKRINVY
jgi:hypothetical protein